MPLLRGEADRGGGSIGAPNDLRADKVCVGVRPEPNHPHIITTRSEGLGQPLTQEGAVQRGRKGGEEGGEKKRREQIMIQA